MHRRLGWLAVVLTSWGAGAYELKRDSAGEPVRWSGRAEFVAGPEVLDELGEHDALRAFKLGASAIQEACPGLELTVREGTPTPMGYDFAPGARNQNDLVAIDEWAFDPSAIAVTILTLETKTHRILDADVAFNLEHRKFKVLPGPAASGSEYDDIQNTFTHELGHALGLAHNPAVPEAVMYPQAKRGEINKRLLAPDDRAGFDLLYPEPPAAPAAPAGPGVGCAAAPGGQAGWSVAMLGLAFPWWRRRRLAQVSATLALCLPFSAGAFEQAREEAAVGAAAFVATAEVISLRTLPPAAGARLLWTEVQLESRSCHKGPCPTRWTAKVPGGTWGEIEQSVQGLEVPERGTLVGVTVAPTGATAQASPPPVRIYRLGVLRDFVAFAAGLERAAIRAELTPPGSRTPQNLGAPVRPKPLE